MATDGDGINSSIRLASLILLEKLHSCAPGPRKDPIFISPQKKSLRRCEGLEHKVAERRGFEPRVPFRVRLFSKQVLSATQAPLQNLIRFDLTGCKYIKSTRKNPIKCISPIQP